MKITMANFYPIIQISTILYGFTAQIKWVYVLTLINVSLGAWWKLGQSSRITGVTQSGTEVICIHSQFPAEKFFFQDFQKFFLQNSFIFYLAQYMAT